MRALFCGLGREGARLCGLFLAFGGRLVVVATRTLTLGTAALGRFSSLISGPEPDIHSAAPPPDRRDPSVGF